MSPSKHTLSLEQVTPLFSQPHVQSHQNFLSSLDKHNKIRRAELCRIKRDELLQSFRSIECLFALYSLVFQEHISERDCKEWNEFHKVAKEGSRRLNIIIKVTLAWGNEVVTHYNFVSQCRAHCENLRAVAWYNNKCQPWAKVVEILNASIRIRIQRNDGRSKVSDSRNPILPQDLVYAKRALKGDVKFVNEPTKELSEDYGFDQHGLIVRRRFAASSLSSSTFHDSPRLIIGNNDQDGFPRPTDPRSASQLSSQAQRDIARDSNVAPTPSGQGPPSLSSRPTTLEAIDFATESPSSLRQCSTHTSPTEDNKSTLIPSTPLPASSASSAAPGLTANETSRQSSSSLMEVSPSRSSISENNNHHECTPLTTLSSVPHTVVKSIGCNDASRLPVAFSPSSPSSTSCQQCSRFAESPCVISDPAVPATAPYLSSISHRLLPSSPLATTKFRNSEPSLSPPEEFSHEAKSSMVERPEVACSEDDTAIEQEPSHTATVAFSSTVEATNNPTRSPSTDPNPAFLPPSVSPRSSFHHEITQTLTATSNCRVDGAVKCTVAPCLPTKPELVRKRPGSNSHESSPKKQKENDGDPTTALVTPLRPLSAAASGSHRLDSHATINSTESTPSSPTLAANPWLKDAMLSLDRLDKNKWLNDAIINAYIHVLAKRHGFCFLNSHFLQSVPTLSCKAEYGDPLESDFVLMPIYENHHWYLLVMYKSDTGDTAQNRIVCFLNSLESHPLSSDTSARWIQYLNNLGYQGLVRQRQVKVPQQSNSVDCGVFGLAFAYQIVENLQQFIDSVESGASLGWTIDASKWRRRLRRELELAYGLDSAAPDCKFKNTGHGDDETCADVISACHAFKAPKALKQALSLATVASFEATAVDLEISHNGTMASVFTTSMPPESTLLLNNDVTIVLASTETFPQSTASSRYLTSMSPKFVGSSMTSSPATPTSQSTPVHIVTKREGQASSKEAEHNTEASDKPLSHHTYTQSSSLNTTAAALFEAFSALPREKIKKLQAVNPETLNEEVQKALYCTHRVPYGPIEAVNFNSRVAASDFRSALAHLPPLPNLQQLPQSNCLSNPTMKQASFVTPDGAQHLLSPVPSADHPEMACTIPSPWQAQNRVPSTNSTRQGKSLMKIFSIINPPAQQCSKGSDSPVEDAAEYSPIVNKDPVQVKFTKDGWGPIFGQVNFIHDLEHDRVFNVPDIPPIVPQPGSQLEADILDFRTMGFSHWEDNVARDQCLLLKEKDFWSSEGLDIFASILENAQQLRSFLRYWFGSRVCEIRHCLWWRSTGPKPIYLKQNTGPNDDQCLAFHILPRDTIVRYFAGSHTANWPGMGQEGSPHFTNFGDDINSYTGTTSSDGITLFDPKINFKIESGTAMTIVLGPSNAFEGKGWARLDVKDAAKLKELQRIEKTLGIGWNLS